MVYELIQMVLIVALIVFAILTVELEDLLYAVLCLGGMCICIGGLYWLLFAPYVALFQVLIYGAAIVVLFLSVVMLTRRSEGE